jgi:hypothetical protein
VTRFVSRADEKWQISPIKYRGDNEKLSFHAGTSIALDKVEAPNIQPYKEQKNEIDENG